MQSGKGKFIGGEDKKLRLLRDEIGICVCEDCKFYKYRPEKRKRFCERNRNSAVSSHKCHEFYAKFKAAGLSQKAVM